MSSFSLFRPRELFTQSILAKPFEFAESLKPNCDFGETKFPMPINKFGSFDQGTFSANGVYNLTNTLSGRAMRLVIESASDPAENATKQIGVR